MDVMSIIKLIFVINTSVLHVVLLLCYWEDMISEDECKRVYSLAEWRGEMEALKKPPDKMEGIGNVLNGKWRLYISRLQAKVILLITNVLFDYSIPCVSKCECMLYRNVYL